MDGEGRGGEGRGGEGRGGEGGRLGGRSKVGEIFYKVYAKLLSMYTCPPGDKIRVGPDFASSALRVKKH